MIYSKDVVRDVVRKDDRALDAFCEAVEAMDKFLNAVARYGYQSKQAEERFQAVAGGFGTMEAMVTNFGYRRAQSEAPTKRKRK